MVNISKRENVMDVRDEKKKKILASRMCTPAISQKIHHPL